MSNKIIFDYVLDKIQSGETHYIDELFANISDVIIEHNGTQFTLKNGMLEDADGRLHDINTESINSVSFIKKESDNSKLLNQLEEVKRAKYSSDAKITTLENTINDLRNKLEDRESTIADLRSKNNSLELQLKDRTSVIDTLKNEISDLEDQVDL